MHVARIAGVFAAFALVWSVAQPAHAAPWQKLFSRVEADPTKDYKLGDEHGPWMIMCCSFSGENAESQARELVLEIRKQHKVNAYVYDRVFDYSKPVEGIGVNQFGERRMQTYRRAALDRDKDGKFRELAVLCGDFPTVDDPEAQRLLQRLKYADFETFKHTAGEKDARSLGMLRELQKEVNRRAGGKHAENARKGALGKAFITANPILPDEYFVPKGLDPVVAEMNKDVKYSLLKCTGRYTVKVATFNGSVVIDQKRVKEIEAAGKRAMSDKLAKGTQAAHELTMALREKGYEAWEFHDLHCSMVCVGSFNSLGNKRPDGKLDVDPKITKTLETFGPKVEGNPGEAARYVSGPKMLKEFKDIKFDMAPVVVEVPKKSIARDYERTAAR
jgi:hypothetical protein